METEDMIDENCPCLNCLCVPVCKHKTYGLILKCTTVFEYLYHNGGGTTYQYDLLQVIKSLGLKPVYAHINPTDISQKRTFGDDYDYLFP